MHAPVQIHTQTHTLTFVICFLWLTFSLAIILTENFSHQMSEWGMISEHNYPQARYHYIHSEDGEGCAAMLLEYHTIRGYASEVDLFITQAVLQ